MISIFDKNLYSYFFSENQVSKTWNEIDKSREEKFIIVGSFLNATVVEAIKPLLMEKNFESLDIFLLTALFEISPQFSVCCQEKS